MMLPCRLVRRATVSACIALALVLGMTPNSDAYLPITVGGVIVHWASAPVSYVINATGSSDVADDSEFLAIRQAFAQWQNDPTSNISFVEDTGSNTLRSDYAADDIHLVMFDETNSTGLFTGSSGTIAVTPITFNTLSGAIIDADIIYNGANHPFTTNKTAFTFDIQSIATHEIGHFIGLDHSGCCGSTMFPFADTANTAPRSISLDDRTGVQAIYPGGGSFGFVTGVVKRQADSSAVSGAHVIAVDSDGNIATSTVTTTSGVYLLTGLAAGNYTILAEPFDGPVGGSNLSSDIGASLATDFSTTFLGGNSSPSVVAVTTSNTTVAADLLVGGMATINCTAASEYPAVCPVGAFTGVAVAGTGFTGTETLSVSGADVSLFAPSFVGGTFSFFVQVQSGAVPGSRNFEIRSGSELVVFSGLIDVVAAAPTISNVSPSQGSILGGTSVTLTGTNFQSGTSVSFGDTLAASSSVDSSTQITATTPAHASGSVRVQVEMPDGQVFSNSSITFDFVAQPTITDIYPTVGQASGGSSVTLVGTQFATGASVTIGGASATIQSLTSTEIVLTTPAGSIGAADVVITNSGGLNDTVVGGFVYDGNADPSISDFTPKSGTAGSFVDVTILGSNFDSAAQVFFGRAANGTGGTLAANIVVQSSNVITCTTPAMSSGTQTVHVENPTGSVAKAGASLVLSTPPGGGGGGGGCFALPPMPRTPHSPTPPQLFGFWIPYGVFLCWLWVDRLRRRQRLPIPHASRASRDDDS